MNNKNNVKGLITASALTFFLQGCALWQDDESQKVDPAYPHINSTQSPLIKVPDGMSTPHYSDEYAIPELNGEARAGNLGESLDISSPKLIRPVVTGSRIVEGSREAVVQFDKVNDEVPLDTAIWNSLISYLDERGIGVVEFEKDSQLLKTDWMIIEDDAESPWYSWTKTDRTVGQRFEFKLDLKPHGRSATLHSKLVDYLETVNEDVIADIPNSQVRRNEIEVLNSVISHYEKQLRLADIRRIREIQQGVPTELGFNADGDAAYLVSADYDVTWPRLLLVLRKLGFDVKDLDKSTGLIDATFSGSDEGWWSGLFSSSEKLPLEEGADYRVFVNQQGGKTSVTLKDLNNDALSASVISEMYQSFADVMATDDLDL